MIEDCAVVILAGGQSSRMGRPKAWLDFNGLPLLARIVRRLEATFSEFVVVAAPDQEVPETRARIVRDEIPGQGPVGGMLAGMAAVEQPWALLLSCDVPFVNPAVARHLASAAEGYDTAVPEWEGRLHPLQAVYHASTRGVLQALFDEGRRRPVDLYERVPTLIVREAALRVLDPEGLTFLNVNRPEEYAAALARLAVDG